MKRILNCLDCIWHGACDAEDDAEDDAGEVFCRPGKILVGYVPLPATVEEMRHLIGGVK